MKTFVIKDVKLFMQKLLTESETSFDQFLLCEANISTFASFNIDGHLNKSFYSDEEFSELKNSFEEEGRIFSSKMVRWKSVKNTCFQLIKGEKTPISFRIVLYLSDENTVKFLSGLDTDLKASDIDRLSLVIKYDSGVLNCTSNASLHIFTLDRSIEQAWDKMIDKFLYHLNVRFEQL